MVRRRCKMMFMLLISLTQMYSQNTPRGGFIGEVIAGTNFSQLDGDGLSGFNHIGLRGGLRFSYPISSRRGISLSLLYDQKGSSSGIFSSAGLTRNLSLDYVSLPISYYLGSWWDDEYNDNRIRLFFSVIPSRLINISSTHPDFEENQDRWSRWDFSLAVMVSYSLSKKMNAEIRLERSLGKIYSPPGQDFSAIQSYLVSVQFSYQLNQQN